MRKLLAKIWRGLFALEAPSEEVIFRIKGKDLKRFEALRDKTGVSDVFEVLNDAFRTWEGLQSRLEEGIVFWAQTPQGEMVPAKFLRQPINNDTDPNGPQIVLVVDNDNPDFEPR